MATTQKELEKEVKNDVFTKKTSAKKKPKTLTQRVNELEKRVNEHERNFCNPHCDMANQLDCYTKQEVDELIMTASKSYLRTLNINCIIAIAILLSTLVIWLMR